MELRVVERFTLQAAHGALRPCACSIWALGCVLFEICALKPAFYSFNCDGITKKIKSGKVPAIPAEYSESLRQLVRSMLYTDEAKRPTAEAIVAMPFLQVHPLLCIVLH